MHTPAISGLLEDVGERERSRLIGLCARLTGDPDAAEDLAQETLLEAWRNRHKLRDGAASWPWLSAIARNVYLRWAWSRRREWSRAEPSAFRRIQESEGIRWPADDFDLEVELERRELVELLDRALALLPTATRDALVQKYVRELPQAEVVARLGISEGAVSMRLRRGKLRLKRALTTELREEAAAYGLWPPDADGWRETRIWCMGCGRHRLLGRLVHSTGEFSLRCPGNCAPGATVAHAVSPDLFRGVVGFKPALTRLQRHAGAYYRRALERGAAPCWLCGCPLPLRPGLAPSELEATRGAHGVHVRCADCGVTSDQELAGHVLSLPEVMRFWWEHPRMRTVRGVEVESHGSHAVVTSVESVTDSCRLDVVSARDTFAVLGIHGSLVSDSASPEA